jgi:hypothetical protein
MKRLGIILLIVCTFSCKSSAPKDVLSPQKMQAVLWDVMQADEMAEYYSTSDSTFKELPKHVDYYQKVFMIHKISKEDFTRSLLYYQNHPSELKPILDSMQRFGQRLQDKDSLAKKPYNPIGNDTTKRKLHMKVGPI